jgi:hypothetical protein
MTLVSYSDIQTLPDLTCYVTLPGPYPAVKLPLKYQSRPKVAAPFIPRQVDSEAECRLSAVLTTREEEGRRISELFAQPETDATGSERLPDGVRMQSVAPAEASAHTPHCAVPTDDQTAGTFAATPAGHAGGQASLRDDGVTLPPGLENEGEAVDFDAYARWQSSQVAERAIWRPEDSDIPPGHASPDEVEVGDSF